MGRSEAYFYPLTYFCLIVITLIMMSAFLASKETDESKEQNDNQAGSTFTTYGYAIGLVVISVAFE